MAQNTATQNPSNKVGRNSGAGEGGVSQMAPTRQEAARGVERIGGREARGPRYGRWGIGVGAATLVGAAVAAYIRRAREPRTVRERMMRRVGL